MQERKYPRMSQLTSLCFYRFVILGVQAKEISVNSLRFGQEKKIFLGVFGKVNLYSDRVSASLYALIFLNAHSHKCET